MTKFVGVNTSANKSTITQRLDETRQFVDELWENLKTLSYNLEAVSSPTIPDDKGPGAMLPTGPKSTAFISRIYEINLDLQQLSYNVKQMINNLEI